MTLTVLMKRMVIEIVQGGQLEISSDSVSDISKVSSYVSKVSPPQYLYSFTNISGIRNCKVPPPRPFVPALFLEIQGLNQLGLLKIPPIFKHFPNQSSHKYSLSPHIAQPILLPNRSNLAPLHFPPTPGVDLQVRSLANAAGRAVPSSKSNLQRHTVGSSVKHNLQ